MKIMILKEDTRWGNVERRITKIYIVFLWQVFIFIFLRILFSYSATEMVFGRDSESPFEEIFCTTR